MFFETKITIFIHFLASVFAEKKSELVFLFFFFLLYEAMLVTIMADRSKEKVCLCVLEFLSACAGFMSVRNVNPVTDLLSSCLPPSSSTDGKRQTFLLDGIGK